MDMTSNFFGLCTNVKVYLYNYSLWVELSMKIFGQSHHVLSYFVFASREGSGKTGGCGSCLSLTTMCR